MNLEKNFPILSGKEQQEGLNKNTRDSFFDKLLKKGKKVAAPAIAGLVALGSVKEGNSQTSNRVLSLNKAIEAKVGDTLSVQENDSTVHMFKKVKQRDDGTFKIKDLGTIKITKGDAIKIGNIENKESILNDRKNNNSENVSENRVEKNEDAISVNGKQYKPYRTTAEGETPKDKNTGKVRSLSDGTPKYVWVPGKGWYVISNEKIKNSKEKNDNSQENIIKNGKKYIIHNYGESPFDSSGKIKSNFIYEKGSYWKLAE